MEESTANPSLPVLLPSRSKDAQGGLLLYSDLSSAFPFSSHAYIVWSRCEKLRHHPRAVFSLPEAEKLGTPCHFTLLLFTSLFVIFGNIPRPFPAGQSSVFTVDIHHGSSQAADVERFISRFQPSEIPDEDACSQSSYTLISRA